LLQPPNFDKQAIDMQKRKGSSHTFAVSATIGRMLNIGGRTPFTSVSVSFPLVEGNIRCGRKDLAAMKR
jgi:hypothetical protein